MKRGGRGSLPERAGAKGCYVKVYQFMCSALGLSGVELLVFARVFGFTLSGLPFYESRAKTAEFFGCTRRAVIAAVGNLTEKGLIIEAASDRSSRSGCNKEYVVDLDRVSKLTGIAIGEDASPLGLSDGDRTSLGADEVLSPSGVRDIHPILKGKEI